MKKINVLSYENNGIIINFQIIKDGEIDTKMYSFQVEDDDALTIRLRESVKNIEVRFGSIGYCAAALFNIIQDKSFSTLTTGEEAVKLLEAFQKKFSEAPIFEYNDIRKKNAPMFQAHLMNTCIDEDIFGEGRTKQLARVEALRKCLGK